MAAKLCMCSIVILVLHLSISLSKNTKDYYTLLGVSKDASTKDIKKAFRKLAMKYHPDKNPDEDAKKTFEEIANAYDILSDSEKRKHYDMYGADGPSPNDNGGRGGPWGGPPPDFHFDYNSFFGKDSGHGEFHFKFEDFFGDDDESLFGEDDFFGDFPNMFGGPLPGFGGHPPGFGGHPPGFGGHPPGFGGHPPGFGGHPPGFGGHPPGFGGHPPGFGGHPPPKFGGGSCKTVTKRVGNTVSTFTTCS